MERWFLSSAAFAPSVVLEPLTKSDSLDLARDLPVPPPYPRCHPINSWGLIHVETAQGGGGGVLLLLWGRGGQLLWFELGNCSLPCFLISFDFRWPPPGWRDKLKLQYLPVMDFTCRHHSLCCPQDTFSLSSLCTFLSCFMTPLPLPTKELTANTFHTIQLQAYRESHTHP